MSASSSLMLRRGGLRSLARTRTCGSARASASASASASAQPCISNGRFFSSAKISNDRNDTDVDIDRKTVLTAIQEDESIRNSMAYSLAMASPSQSHPQKFPPMTPPLDSRMKEQLKISRNQLLQFGSPSSNYYNSNAIANSNSNSNANTTNRRPSVDLSLDLPRTLSDALRPTSRAVVITETQKPFRILDVNKAWEGLCEYTHVESRGKSLGSLIQGPETDPMAITALMAKLLHGETATTILTNYTKSGRKFKNRLTVGPLYDDETGDLSQFVGVLQEV